MPTVFTRKLNYLDVTRTATFEVTWPRVDDVKVPGIAALGEPKNSTCEQPRK
jgi:hypothetical protein